MRYGRIPLGALVIAVLMALAVYGLKLHGDFAGRSAGKRVAKNGTIGTRSSTRLAGRRGSPFLPTLKYRPMQEILDTSGFGAVIVGIPHWEPDASLQEISRIWHRAGFKAVDIVDGRLTDPKRPPGAEVPLLFLKVALLNYEGEVERSYKVLENLRSIVERDDRLEQSAARHDDLLPGRDGAAPW